MTNKIKFSVLLTLFTFVSFITTSALASVLVDGIYYELNNSDKTAEVANSNETYTGVIDIPASFVYEGTTYKVTTIASLAFIDCANVETVKIPSTVTGIKPSSFERCGLTSIEIGIGVIYIDFEAFRDCNKLVKLTLPSSLEIIENEAFAGCTSLAEIYVNRNDPPKLITKAFDGVDKANCKVYVPSGRKSTYARATGWKDFSNISEYSFDSDVTVNMGVADSEGNRWAGFCCDHAVLLPAGLTAYYDRSRSAYVMSTTSNMYLRFCVAEEYSAGQYLVDTSIGQSVQSAVDNADAIVSEYSGLSDEEKLRAYKDEICVLVSYNSSATGGASYGNPWQMIWVFDGDPGTNVVCEGYAKAFKYLCDHTVFDSSIECILAGGDLVRGSRSEPHMWNVLKMDDGNNYLVDVTNCDSGNAGYPDKLFLAGTTQTRTNSNGNTGYYFAGSGLAYYYDTDTQGIFSETDLELFLHDYGKHEWESELTIDEEPTCTEAGSRSGHCVICDGVITEVIPAVGHNYSGWNLTKKETCTEAGSQEKVCANCGDVITQAIPATGHKYGSWKVTRKATGIVTGIREKVCANCGAKITEKIPILSGTWKKDSTGWWYQWSDRSYPAKMFLKISGKTYYFNASGYMVTGWQYIGGKWYYFDGSGAMVTGWQYLGGKWYYMNSSGVMLTGKQYIGGKWYYFNGSGAMVTGWQYIGGKWYYFNGSGAMVTGWQYIGGKWYYMNSSGVMLTGWQYLGGKWYYMNGSGAMVTGWQYLGGKWYYMNGSGAMVTGWQYLGGKWYYMNSSGAMVTGWQTINGTRYYFDASGAMQ